MSGELFNREEYRKLIPKYIDAKIKFNEKEEILRREIFGKLDEEKRLVEIALEEEFKEIWASFGDEEYSFEKFRVYIDMNYGPHHYFQVMGMKTPHGEFDLENIAKKYPSDERIDYKLENYEEYRDERGKIETSLSYLGFDRLEMNKEVKNFFNFHGLLPPKVRYFEKV